MMREEPNEMENNDDSGSLERIGIPKCIEVKVEDSDIGSDVPERIGNRVRNVIIKDEDEGILTVDIDYWSLDQTTQDTTTTTSVETMKMEYPDENVFEETNDIKLESTIFKDKDMPDPFDIKSDVIVMAIEQEELTIKSEKEDFYEDNLNNEERNLDFKPCLRSASNSEDDTDGHDLRHKSATGFKTYSCGKFDNEIRMFNCNECDFQTKYKWSLKNHKLGHKSATSVEMFSCGECDYQTKIKYYLTKHMFRHKNITECEMFSCGECNYQTKYKYILKTHQKMKHRSAAEIQMFSCDKCDYQTNRKSNLKSHSLRHRRAAEIEMFTCGDCNYETKYKHHLKPHKLRHRNPVEIPGV